MVLLLALAAVVYAFAGQRGWLEPERVYDTISYEWFLEDISFTDRLQSLRTFGYPLFLDAYRLFADDYSALPTVHLALYLGAVLVFWLGARSYTGSAWLAFAAAAPLLAPCILPWARWIVPEMLAPTCAVLTIGLLLLLASRPRNVALWIGVAAGTLMTYHMRPAYVPIVVLVPLIGFTLRLGVDSRRLRRFAWTLTAVSVLPLLAYGGLRWVVVGHFGLVNFDGYELLGIAACMLDRETAAAMPREHRELAARILRQRELRGWTRYELTSRSRTFFDQYGRNQWFIGEPLARQIVMRERRRYRQKWGEERLPISPLERRQIERAERMPPLNGELAQVMNARLRGFSEWLIRRHPVLYLKWVRDGYLYGLGRAFACHTVSALGGLLAVSLPFFFVRGRARPPERISERSRRRAAFLVGMILLAVGFFAAKLALMVLVSWPWDRYLFAALLFVPSGLGAALFEMWR